jgi:hypothetical protein
VAHLSFNFVDALHAKVGALADCFGRRFGNHARFG